MTPAPVDADSPELAALRGPACLLDVADGEVLPGEAGSDAYRSVQRGWSGWRTVGTRTVTGCIGRGAGGGDTLR